MGVLEKYGGKLQSMTYLVAIKDAFTDLMPIIIIGSFATLINNVICSTSNGLANSGLLRPVLRSKTAAMRS